MLPEINITIYTDKCSIHLKDITHCKLGMPLFMWLQKFKANVGTARKI